MATGFSCCDLHFNCVNCPIITGPDCVAPNNLLPGQLWYNPCTCTYYFECSGGFDAEDNCSTFTPINHKAGAGIAYSGDCENGSYISVKILAGGGLGFDGTGNLLIDCDALIQNCQLWFAGNCTEMIDHCQLFTRNNLVPADGHFYLECAADDTGEEICTFYIDTIIQARNAGEVSSAGVCVGVQPNSYSNFSAILQGRDLTWIRGNGSLVSTPSGSYLTETFTNPWNDRAFLEVDLICQDNFNASTGDQIALTGKTVTFIHAITENLAVAPPIFGANNQPVYSNWVYNQIDSGSRFFQPDPALTLTYSHQTASGKYTKILEPGESVTLYYQWWAVFDSAAVAPLMIIHAGMATASKLIRHADHF